jgi:hypothetical protein
MSNNIVSTIVTVTDFLFEGRRRLANKLEERAIQLTKLDRLVTYSGHLTVEDIRNELKAIKAKLERLGHYDVPCVEQAIIAWYPMAVVIGEGWYVALPLFQIQLDLDEIQHKNFTLQRSALQQGSTLAAARIK